MFRKEIAYGVDQNPDFFFFMEGSCAREARRQTKKFETKKEAEILPL